MDRKTPQDEIGYWCGFVGPGWRPVVEKTLDTLLVKLGCKVLQVKEKFGGLRIYLDIPDRDERSRAVYEAGEALIDKAVWACWFICEDCGTTVGVSTEGDYIRTLCSRCRTISELA